MNFWAKSKGIKFDKADDKKSKMLIFNCKYLSVKFDVCCVYDEKEELDSIIFDVAEVYKKYSSENTAHDFLYALAYSCGDAFDPDKDMKDGSMFITFHPKKLPQSSILHKFPILSMGAIDLLTLGLNNITGQKETAPVSTSQSTAIVRKYYEKQFKRRSVLAIIFAVLSALFGIIAAVSKSSGLFGLMAPFAGLLLVSLILMVQTSGNKRKAMKQAAEMRK